MNALGQFLLDKGWLHREELLDALHNQQQVGGRLGTSLLEKGYLSEQRLLDALAEQQSSPAASAAELTDIPAAVIETIPAKLASRHLAIPFRAFGSRVDVAVARTDNLAQLDELAFAVGKTLRPHVAVEARLYDALERYYRVPCPRRFRLIVDSLDNGRLAATGPRPAAIPSAAGPPASSETRVRSGRRRWMPDLRPPEKRSIPLSEDERRALEPMIDEDAGPPLPERPRDPFAERLAAAGSPREIGELLLAAMDQHFVRSLFFRVSRGTVSGWLGHGPGLDRDWLAGYSVGLRQATVFRRIDELGHFRGQLASLPAHESLARAWGGGLAHECLVVPVRVRGRMVCALYGDRGALGLSGLDRAEIERLAGKAGLALERLIISRKLQR